MEYDENSGVASIIPTRGAQAAQTSDNATATQSAVKIPKSEPQPREPIIPSLVPSDRAITSKESIALKQFTEKENKSRIEQLSARRELSARRKLIATQRRALEEQKSASSLLTTPNPIGSEIGNAQQIYTAAGLHSNIGTKTQRPFADSQRTIERAKQVESIHKDIVEGSNEEKLRGANLGANLKPYTNEEKLQQFDKIQAEKAIKLAALRQQYSQQQQESALTIPYFAKPSYNKITSETIDETIKDYKNRARLDTDTDTDINMYQSDLQYPDLQQQQVSQQQVSNYSNIITPPQNLNTNSDKKAGFLVGLLMFIATAVTVYIPAYYSSKNNASKKP